MRHRTVRTKGALSAKTAKLMVFKLVNCRRENVAAIERRKPVAKGRPRHQIPKGHRVRRAFCSVAKPIMVMPPLSWPLSWMARPFRARNDNCGSCAINHSLDLSLLFSRD